MKSGRGTIALESLAQVIESLLPTYTAIHKKHRSTNKDVPKKENKLSRTMSDSKVQKSISVHVFLFMGCIHQNKCVTFAPVWPREPVQDDSPSVLSAKPLPGT